MMVNNKSAWTQIFLSHIEAKSESFGSRASNKLDEIEWVCDFSSWVNWAVEAAKETTFSTKVD